MADNRTGVARALTCRIACRQERVPTSRKQRCEYTHRRKSAFSIFLLCIIAQLFVYHFGTINMKKNDRFFLPNWLMSLGKPMDLRSS
jgi:hypothetical protein